MYTKVLVKDLIEDGRVLLKALQREKFPVSAAFWVKIPDSERHRLVIASTVAKESGHLEAYRRLQTILKSVPLEQLSFEDISVLGPNEADYKALRTTAAGPGLEMGPSGGKLRDAAFEDAYIYYL
jgi:hypothetical protein